ncbi:MAG TPA: DUF979 domain-containing protein [Kofleriaceae bacterium]|nr:DUF979 domain-containing protein [Kofleriaceae bacterium]
MLTLSHVYFVMGALLVSSAVINAIERKWWNAAFWIIPAAPCLVGDQIVAATKAGTKWPAQAMGVGVILLALIASRTRGGVPDRDPADREASAQRLGDRLFVPALAIPVLVAVLVLYVRYVGWPVTRLLDVNQSALISLGIATMVALVVALIITRARPIHGLTEGRRLLDAIGWAVVLPTLLATLGAVFVDTGVGKAVAAVVSYVIPTQSWLACLLAYGLGMVAFTAIMGNAFAAFPVMMAGVGLPLLIQRHGANPAALGALGMVTGYCGTLLTPMAANFNIVPAILLELRDQYGVIRMQVPTALALLAANFVLMMLLVFR